MRRLVSAFAAVLTVLVGGLLITGSALAQAPEATGWWSFASHPEQNAPPPPDVDEGDLLVQGGDLGGAAPDLGLPTSPSAVAALRFTLPEGVDARDLTLQLGSNGRATDVRAYPVKKDDWKPSQGGPLAEAPVAEGTRYATGVLDADATQLTFRDMARFVRPDGRLSIVLIPGATDRVVVKKPTPAALTVTEPQGQTSAPPPATTGTAPVSPVTGVGTAPMPALDPATLPAEVEPPTGLAAPLVAAGAPPPAAAPAVAAPAAPAAQDPTAALVAADQRTRYLVAIEALLVLVTFGLIGWGPMSRLAALTGQPPLTDASAARGVGRFVRERTGEVPRL